MTDFDVLREAVKVVARRRVHRTTDLESCAIALGRSGAERFALQVTTTDHGEADITAEVTNVIDASLDELWDVPVDSARRFRAELGGLARAAFADRIREMKGRVTEVGRA